MKTPEQIRRWLESHKWYGSFMRQTIESVMPTNAGRVLLGELGRHTITAGFIFRNSDEGYEFWHKVDNQFKEWYEKEGK